MTMNEEEVKKFIEKNFKLSHNFNGPLNELFPTNIKEVSYEAALKIVLETVFNRNLENCSVNPLSNEKFVEKFFHN